MKSNNPVAAAKFVKVAIQKRSGFTCLPNWLAGEATPQEGWLLWTLQSFAPCIHPSLETLAGRSGMGKSTVCRVLHQLKEKGWIRTEQRFASGNRHGSTVYEILVWDLAPMDSQGCQKSIVPERDNQTETPVSMGVPERDNGLVWLCQSGTGIVPERDTNKKDLTRNKLKTQEPPFVFPPAGESAGQAAATHTQPDPYPDQVQTQDPNPLPEHPDPCLHQETHQRPLGAAVSHENPPKASFPDDPQQGALETLLEASEENTPAKGKKTRFQPTEADIPAILLPVRLELLGFWKAKAGKKTSEAWDALLANLRKIWDDPAGGTDVLRQQLEAGIEAKTYGDGWQSITYANWSKYAKEWHRPKDQPQLTNAQKVGLSALAKIRAMEAQKAQEQQSNTLTLGGSLL
jgi:hypothetical protein